MVFTTVNDYIFKLSERSETASLFNLKGDLMDRKRYGYEGPVKVFENIVDWKWYGETVAVSEKKAKNNLRFQVKNNMGLLPSAKVDLPNEVFLIEE